MPVNQLKEYLDAEQVKYVSIYHSCAYTAQETAASAHISGKRLAKTVIVNIDGRMAMVVLPAAMHINLMQVREVAGADTVVLASEEEFKDSFPNCEIGAMPPFGNLYGMDVFVDATLSGDEKIAFNAGSHVELIELAYEDFARLVRPTVVSVSGREPSAAA